jgi:hypothetical protein
MLSRHLGIEVPAVLGPDYDRAWDITAARIGLVQTPCRLFNMAWHGFGYRAITMERRAERYCNLPKYGSVSHDANFESDQTLVEFLTSACSAIDCFTFAAFALASARDGTTFPCDTPGTLVAVTRRRIADKFQARWPNDDLTRILIHFRDDKDISALFAIRDVVTHRGALPRTHYIGGPMGGSVAIASDVKALPANWVPDFVLDCAAVQKILGYVANAFNGSTMAVAAFAGQIK